MVSDRVEYVRFQLEAQGKPAHVEDMPWNANGMATVYDVYRGYLLVGSHRNRAKAHAAAAMINERFEAVAKPRPSVEAI